MILTIRCQYDFRSNGSPRSRHLLPVMILMATMNAAATSGPLDTGTTYRLSKRGHLDLAPRRVNESISLELSWIVLRSLFRSVASVAANRSKLHWPTRLVQT